MNTTNLKCWLPFDSSTTLDYCGNSWTTSGSPVIQDNQLYLNGSSYLKLDGKFAFTGQDFTISTKFSATSNTTGGVVCIWQLEYNAEYRLHLGITVNGTLDTATAAGSLYFFVAHGNSNQSVGKMISAASVLDGEIHHAECTYCSGVWYLFLDGQLVNSVSYNLYSNRNFDLYIGTNHTTNRKFKGYVSQFIFYDGVALHTDNFTPPTVSDYYPIDIDLFCDTSRNLKSKWRYENYGTADLLTVSGTTLTDLPVSQAVFKSAFYQTQRVKCFDIPATDDIWCKFDVYSSNYNQRWRAYNESNSVAGNGVCSYSRDIIFWNNSSEVKSVSNLLQSDIRQTVLLHMVSGSSNGIIEAWLDGTLVHSYTGNVNNGNDFENFFLQSDGSSTFFSNVIISNYVIGLNDSTTIDLDLQFDTSRKVAVIFDYIEDFDVKRQVVKSLDLQADTKRQVVQSLDFQADTYRKVVRSVDILCDTLRNIPYKLIIDPVDNSGVPVVLPQTNGIQSIDITISAGQLIDQLSVVTVNDIDILSVIQGQFLDYVYNYRVEKFSRRGILSTCQCCSNLDSLLYTQMAYTLSKTTWNGGLFKQKEINEPDDNDTVTTLPGTVKKKTTTEMINKPVASASDHVFATAQRLGLIPVLLFDDFMSTLDIEQEGVTYQDIISNVFGWSSRVPHKMINVFIRGNFLYVIQRGHEQNTIDISNADIGDNISINRQLIRTSYGVTHKTTDLEKQGWEYELDIGEELEDEEPENPEEPEDEDDDDDDEPEEPARNLPTYERSEEGNVVTEVWYTYDGEGNLEKTTTKTSSGKLGGEFTYPNVAAGGFVSNLVIVENYYTTRPNGEKLIEDEITDEYEMKTEIVQGYDGEGEWHDYAKGTYIWVDGKKIHHTYTTVGQQHVSSASQDGTINGSTTASARRDDRPTPFDDDRNNQLRDAEERQQQAEYDDEGERVWSGSYTYINGKKYKTYGYKRTPKTITGTLDEVLLYDSSFPVDDSKAKAITEDLKWLNRSIQETVTLDVYNFPHVFTLNDKIVYQGKTYYLQSNHVSRTPNITNKQTLELVRWYKNQSNALILPFLVLQTWSRG